jgi:hypothetical protein
MIHMIFVVKYFRRLRLTVEALAYRLDQVIVKRTRMSLLVRHAEIRQNTQDFPRFYF